MKVKALLFLCVILLLNAYTLTANVFRVNSNLTADPSQKLFKSLKAAVEDPAVNAGDTLMIEGSPIVYENITLTKKMVLIGPGYLLSQNPRTQADGALAVVSQIIIRPEAAETIIMGLTFSNSSSFNAPRISASDVIIMRCLLPNNLVLTGTFSNVQIIENFFQGASIGYASSFDNFTGIVLKNNIIQGAINIPSNDNYQKSFATVEHNIFLASVTLTCNIFRSNIIANSAAVVNLSSATVQNNLVGGTQLSGDGNQTYDASRLFIGPTGASSDGQYAIKADSPYKTAGHNGTEPGVFGGSMPYVLSGLPPVPSIYELTAENFASKQTGLQIKVKVKANQ